MPKPTTIPVAAALAATQKKIGAKLKLPPILEQLPGDVVRPPQPGHAHHTLASSSRGWGAPPPHPLTPLLSVPPGIL